MNNVSIRKVKTALKNMQNDPIPVTVTINDSELEFEVVPFIELSTMRDMVQAVVDASFEVDTNTGMTTFDHTVHDYLTWALVLTNVANFKADIPADLMYRLVCNYDVRRAICQHWNPVQRESYFENVALQAEYRKQDVITANQKRLDDLTRQIEQASAMLLQVVQTTEGLDMHALGDSLAKLSALDEVELGRAVVAARDADFVQQRAQSIPPRG